jgi:hypothetical protein
LHQAHDEIDFVKIVLVPVGIAFTREKHAEKHAEEYERSFIIEQSQRRF